MSNRRIACAVRPSARRGEGRGGRTVKATETGSACPVATNARNDATDTSVGTSCHTRPYITFTLRSVEKGTPRERARTAQHAGRRAHSS